MANIVVLGPPGSGKGTQAERIAGETGWPHISTGDILRHAVEAETKLGLRAKEWMDRGELVPDDVVDAIVVERLSHPDCLGGFILDGFPRDLKQAETLDRLVKLDVVFYIRVPDAFIVERLSLRRICDCGETYHLKYNPPEIQGVCDRCGRRIYQRKDDMEATIRHRLEVYHRQTEPLIRYYSGKGLLVELDGTKDIDSIAGDIKAVLNR